MGCPDPATSSAASSSTCASTSAAKPAQQPGPVAGRDLPPGGLGHGGPPMAASVSSAVACGMVVTGCSVAGLTTVYSGPRSGA